MIHSRLNYVNRAIGAWQIAFEATKAAGRLLWGVSPEMAGANDNARRISDLLGALRDKRLELENAIKKMEAEDVSKNRS